MKAKIICLITFLTLVGCNDERELDGMCHTKILDSAQFNSNSNEQEHKVGKMQTSTIFSVHKNTFGIRGITLNGEQVLNENKETIDVSFKKTPGKLFENDVFIIEKINATQIKITVKENTTGKQRTLGIGFWSGNCYDNAQIIQSS